MDVPYWIFTSRSTASVIGMSALGAHSKASRDAVALRAGIQEGYGDIGQSATPYRL